MRAKSFDETMGVLSGVFAGRFRDVRFRGCHWAEAEGARPASRLSVPGCETSGGGTADPEDEQLAIWRVLYTDPWRELRLLGLQKATTRRASPGAEPAEQVFLRGIRQWEPSPELRKTLTGYGLSAAFDEALVRVRASAELRAAAKTAEIDAHAHRYVVARALVACAIVSLGEVPAPTGAGRNVVLEAVARDLDAIRKKVPGWVQNLGTLYLRARRGKHIDGITPMLGDILRYQARGEGLHELIARSVDDVPGDGPVTLLGHSLGGIACVDLPATDPPERVDRSPVPPSAQAWT
ncbi:hypothetical protein OG948_02050 [Embleya sp. NBC_00888]|uniref:hypothetical protein n=1 Tax=Embleya sp. NBC_00888 TaxID=2975960 RepID=UPI00386EAFE3|nr:hypothetical protein OG948_02050 [Embleya sp. NBC_00888]